MQEYLNIDELKEIQKDGVTIFEDTNHFMHVNDYGHVESDEELGEHLVLSVQGNKSRGGFVVNNEWVKLDPELAYAFVLCETGELYKLMPELTEFKYFHSDKQFITFLDALMGRRINMME